MTDIRAIARERAATFAAWQTTLEQRVDETRRQHAQLVADGASKAERELSNELIRLDQLSMIQATGLAREYAELAAGLLGQEARSA